jgi:hypothetical protein
MWFGLTEGFEREFDQWRTIEHMRSGSVFQAFFGVRVTGTRRLIGRFEVDPERATAGAAF